MNPLAEKLNQHLKKINPGVFDTLSEYGRRVFFPHGILKQAGEAKQKAHKIDATLGIATEEDHPMYLDCFHQYVNNMDPKEIYPYAAPAGIQELRDVWLDKIRRENPDLKNVPLSKPIVTSGLTNGINVAADLFADVDDELIIPDKLWPNYRLIFNIKKQSYLRHFHLFSQTGGFNLDGMKLALEGLFPHQKKVMISLNFPNNPTGYCPTNKEMEAIANLIVSFIEQSGTAVVTLIDDAYYGLSYEQPNQPSIFSFLANRHEKLLALKLDGITKEAFAWGFRVGFMTYSCKSPEPDSLFDILSEKTVGVLRASISSSSHVSQRIALKGLTDSAFHTQQHEKRELLLKRYEHTKEILSKSNYSDAWSVYPFNSGYFLTLQLKNAPAEQVRLRLLDDHGIGTISLGDTDLRITFSCLELNQIEPIFDTIYQCVKTVEQEL